MAPKAAGANGDSGTSGMTPQSVPQGSFAFRCTLAGAGESIPGGRLGHQRRALEAELVARFGELLMSNRPTLPSWRANRAPTQRDVGALGLRFSERSRAAADRTYVHRKTLSVPARATDSEEHDPSVVGNGKDGSRRPGGCAVSDVSSRDGVTLSRIPSCRVVSAGYGPTSRQRQTVRPTRRAPRVAARRQPRRLRCPANSVSALFEPRDQSRRTVPV
jgi:hypothetical protein